MRWRADGSAFEQAVLPHLDAAHGLARWLTRDPRLAEDVVQDAVLRALTYFPSFRGGDARAWLLRIVRNSAHDNLRAQKPAECLEAAEAVPDNAANPEAALDNDQARSRLAQALGALPIDLRETLVLRELQDLSYKDIATICGVPIGTVMSRLWRARQTLGAALRQEA